MKKLRFLFIAWIIVLIVFSMYGCAASDNNTAKVAKTNLDGFSVFESLNQVVYKDGETIDLENDEVLLFVNGSLAPIKSAYLADDTILVSADAVSEIFDAEYTFKSDDEISLTYGDSASTCRFKSIHDRAFITLDSVKDVFGCNTAYYDSDTSDAEYILQSYPHVMISEYPSDSSVISAEEAAAYLKKQLTKAYENKFGAFEPLNERPAEYSDKDSLRYMITMLDAEDVKCENDRFYVIECIYDYYVDKYSDDIFTHYTGLDETFYLFDADSENALSIAG